MLLLQIAVGLAYLGLVIAPLALIGSITAMHGVEKLKGKS